MKLEQAARQAFEALEMYNEHGAILRPLETTRALRKALALYDSEAGIEQAELMEENISHHKSEQEPVAWVTAKESFCGFPKLVFSETQKDGYKPLYAAPVRTKDLTDKQIEKVWNKNGGYMGMPIDFARAVIAADREKNK